MKSLNRALDADRIKRTYHPVNLPSLAVRQVVVESKAIPNRQPQAGLWRIRTSTVREIKRESAERVRRERERESGVR